MNKVLAGVALTIAIAVTGLVAGLGHFPGGEAEAVTGVADPTGLGTVAQVAIDMESAGNPANGLLTAIDTCNNVTALPVAGTKLSVDVIVDEIDPADGYEAFQFQINYDPTKLSVAAAGDVSIMMLGANGGSLVIPIIDVSNDAAGFTIVGGSDFLGQGGQVDAVDEQGEGVQARIAFTGVGDGLSPITLSLVKVTTSAAGDITPGAGITTVGTAEAAVGTATCPAPPQPADVALVSQDITFGGAGPIPASQDATLTIDKIIENLGPMDPVDIDITKTITLPPDCTVDTVNDNPDLGPQQGPVVVVTDTVLNVAVGQPVNYTENDLIHCMQPSDHQITVENCLSPVDAPVPDPVPGNNCLTNIVPFAVSAVSDLEVQTVAVSGPAGQANVGQPFDVTATVTVNNLGPYGPVNADTTAMLNIPADCDTGDPNPQTVQDTSFPVSTPTGVDVTWSVTCISASFHTFSANGSVALDDDPHVIDSNANNDGPVDSTQPDTVIPVNDLTDVSVSSVTVTAPASNQSVGSPFDVTADVEVSNNGDVDPVDVTTTITLNLPADCSTGDTNPVTDPNRSVAQADSPVSIPTVTWSVTCTDPSNHVFTVNASTSITTLHVSDSNPGNDSDSGQDSVIVEALADLEVNDVSVSGPASAGVGEPFDVTASVEVQNNGPFEPVNAKLDATLILPADCNTSDPNPQGQIPLNNLIGVTTVDVTWSVTCDNKSFHNFEASALIVVNQLHVLDNDDTNDSRASDVPATVAIIDEADLWKTLEVLADDCQSAAPTEIAVNTDVDLCVVSTIHNDGPVDTIFDDLVDLVSAPDDCEVSSKKDGFPIGSVGVPLPAGEDWVFEDSITINCSQPSSHTFEFENTVDISGDEIHIVDPDLSNNSAAATVTIAVTAPAVLKVVDVTVDAPASATVDTAFDVTVDATVHNDGPFEPVDADVTVTFDADDCSVSGDSTATVAVSGLLIASAATSIPQQTFSVTCSGSGAKTFSATVTIAALHVGEGSGDGSDTTTVAAVAAATATPAPTPTPAVAGASALPAAGGEGPSDSSWMAAYVAAAAILGLIGAATIYGVRRRRSHNR